MILVHEVFATHIKKVNVIEEVLAVSLMKVVRLTRDMAHLQKTTPINEKAQYVIHTRKVNAEEEMAVNFHTKALLQMFLEPLLPLIQRERLVLEYVTHFKKENVIEEAHADIAMKKPVSMLLLHLMEVAELDTFEKLEFVMHFKRENVIEVKVADTVMMLPPLRPKSASHSRRGNALVATTAATLTRVQRNPILQNINFIV